MKRERFLPPPRDFSLNREVRALSYRLKASRDLKNVTKSSVNCLSFNINSNSFFYYGTADFYNKNTHKKVIRRKRAPRSRFFIRTEHAFNTALIYQYNPVNSLKTFLHTLYSSHQPEKKFFFMLIHATRKKTLRNPPKTINLPMYLKAASQKSVNPSKAWRVFDER